MTTLEAAVEEGRERYPDASEETLAKIAQKAQKSAEDAESEGQAEGIAFSAVQAEYGCDWQWGDGGETRDAAGNLVIDEDDEPRARVYDCDGNTIAIIAETD